VRRLLLFAVVLGALPAADPARRDTLSGAYWRAYNRLEWVRRGWDQARINQGAVGRINATGGAARQAEEPSLPVPPPSSW
jgi:hypothetical protein